MYFLKKHALLIVLGILSIHFILGLVISSQESMIYDERAHIPAAYSYVRYGDMRLNPEHPPLIKDLAGLPLLAMNLTFPLSAPQWQTGTNEQWTMGDLFLNCTEPQLACNDADKILFWSRLPITLLSVILGLGLFFFTRKLAGTLAGLFSVVLYAFDPNIIAHNHYVTTDIGIATFLFFAFYTFVSFLRKPTLKNMLIAGIFLGLAELTKVSAILLFPLFGLFVLLFALTKHQEVGNYEESKKWRWHTLLQYSLKFIGMVLTCFVIIWTVYAWNTIHMPSHTLIDSANLYLSQNNIPARFAHNLVVQTSDNAFLKPFSQYFLGVAMIFARVESGNYHYFLGEVTMEPSAWYFPAVFILKETLPFLLLLLLTTGYTFYRILKSVIERNTSLREFFAHSFQNRVTQYLMFAFIVLYVYVSLTGKLNIGMRHLFPLLPLLYLLVAKTLFDFFDRHDNDKTSKKTLSILIGITTLIIMSIPVLTYPNYLSYFNIAVGGNQNGYKYVTDSNYDWGQDLKRLKGFVDLHNRCKKGEANMNEEKECALTENYPPIEKIRVDYFGGSSPAYYLGDMFIPWWDQRDPEPGWYAISSFFYQESLYKKKPIGTKDYSWLKDVSPLRRAGNSLFIYYVDTVGNTH